MVMDVDDMILQMSKGDPTNLGLTDFIKRQLTAINHTPDHPVYAIMIEDAITGLNEKGGSTREAISEFILGKYDVINVVHPSKLIDQLRKLVSRNEIILTSENRYMVSVENSTVDTNLKLVEEGLNIPEQDEQGCKPSNSEEVVNLLGVPNEKNGNQCQSAVGEMNVIMGSQHEELDVRVCKPCNVEGHLQEDQNTISEEQQRLQCPSEPLIESPSSQVAGFISQDNLQEEQTPEFIKMFLDGKKSTRNTVKCEGDELSGPPGFQIEDSRSEMLTLEGKVLTMSGPQIVEVNEGNIMVIDEVAPCAQNVNQVNDERDAEEFQQSREDTQTTELSQAKGQAPKEVEDKVQNFGAFLALLPPKDKLSELKKRMLTMEQELKEYIEQTKTCVSKDVLKSQLKLVVTSADSLFMNLEQQYLSSSECILGMHDTQKLSECEVVASSSPPEPIECLKLDLEQQLEPGMMGRAKNMELSESQEHGLDNNSQQKHAECNLEAMASDAIQILENSPNMNVDAVKGLAGIRKQKRSWKNELPTRRGLRPRYHEGAQTDETKAETLQPMHVSGRKDKPHPDASKSQKKPRGRPPKNRTA